MQRRSGEGAFSGDGGAALSAGGGAAFSGDGGAALSAGGEPAAEAEGVFSGGGEHAAETEGAFSGGGEHAAETDVTLVLPAVYTDHPSFPEALLARSLEAAGFSVAIVQQPRWQEAGAFAKFPRPKLFFAIVPGPVDSIVLNYTSARKRRQEDLYQFDGMAYFDGPKTISSKIRPDRVLTVFAARIRESFKETPIIIGGLEGSLRKFAHWDFQQEKVRRPILLDTRADLLVTGMGEKQIVRIAKVLAAGEVARFLILAGTARVTDTPPKNALFLPAMESVLERPALLLEQYQAEQEALRSGRPAAQGCGKRFVVYEGAERYTREEIDALYTLPFTRTHIMADAGTLILPSSGANANTSVRPAVPNASARLTIPSQTTHGTPSREPARDASCRMTPALRMNLFSITTHRGCGGGCAFCSIAAHDGGGILSRSPDSIAHEVRRMQAHPSWRGIIGDLGAASAEMYGADCKRGNEETRRCARASCLTPLCPRYAEAEGRAWLELLRSTRDFPGVRKVMLASGVRYEALLRNPRLLEETLTHHTGRFLRVAPEHTEDHVLALMGKPPHALFVNFLKLFRETAARLSRPIDLACYIMVGHPGESAEDAARMREKLEALGLLRRLDVQIFTPSPGSLSTALYCAARDPEGRAIPAERSIKELLRRQRMFL